MTIFELASNNRTAELKTRISEYPNEINSRYTDGRSQERRNAINLLYYGKLAAQRSSYFFVSVATLAALFPPALTAFELISGSFVVGGGGTLIGEAYKAELRAASYNQNGWTPLHFAASRGATEAALELINTGATVSNDHSGKDFFKIAEACGYASFVASCRAAINARARVSESMNDEREASNQKLKKIQKQYEQVEKQLSNLQNELLKLKKSKLEDKEKMREQQIRLAQLTTRIAAVTEQRDTLMKLMEEALYEENGDDAAASPQGEAGNPGMDTRTDSAKPEAAASGTRGARPDKRKLSTLFGSANMHPDEQAESADEDSHKRARTIPT